MSLHFKASGHGDFMSFIAGFGEEFARYSRIPHSDRVQEGLGRCNVC